MPRAAGLAAAIKKELGIESELLKGGGGVFDVAVNGERIFSKHEQGRYPEEAEVIEAIREHSDS